MRPFGYLGLAVSLTIIGAAYVVVCGVVIALASGALPTKPGVEWAWWLPYAGAVIGGWMILLFTPGVLAQALISWALTARAFGGRYNHERLASFHKWGPKVTLAAPLHETRWTRTLVQVDRFAWGNDWRVLLSALGLGILLVASIMLR